jgi:hypothetical protein
MQKAKEEKKKRQERATEILCRAPENSVCRSIENSSAVQTDEEHANG